MKTNKYNLLLTICILFIFGTINLSLCKVYGITLNYDGVDHEYNASPIVLTINGNVLDQSTLPMQPVIIDGTTLVPVREVFEALGSAVDYKAQSKEVYIGYNNALIVMKIDSPTYTVDNKEYIFSVKPKIINGKTMIPLRAVSEGLGLNVDWENSTRTISINDNKTQIKPETEPETKPTEETKTPVSTIIPAVDRSTSTITKSASETTTITGLNAYSNSISINSSSPITNISKMLLQDNRFIIDIENSQNGLQSSITTPQSIYYSNVRSSQFQTSPTKITRIVMQLSNGTNYNVILSPDRQSIIINFGDSNSVFTNTTPTVTTPNTPNTTTTQITDPTKPIYFDTQTHSIVINKNTGLKLSDITINDYDAFNKNILVEFNNDYSNLIGNSKQTITDTYFNSYEPILVNGKSVIKIKLNVWGTLSAKENDTHIIIPFTDPHTLYSKIVIIDAGHGGVDGGTKGHSLTEKILNFTVAHRFGKAVSSQSDIKVYYTRIDDTKLELKSIGQFATKMGDLLFSVHTNGFTTATPTGVEVLYLDHANDSTIGISSKQCATIAQKNLVADTGMYNRGIKSSQLIIFKNSNIPSILGEMGFISNPNDAKNLGDDSFLTTVANSYARSTIEIFQNYTPKR